jgi:hypothetical protein
MIQSGYQTARSKQDATAMISAGLALGTVTGEIYSNKRHIDLQYTQAIKQIEAQEDNKQQDIIKGQAEPKRLDLSSTASNPLKVTMSSSD